MIGLSLLSSAYMVVCILFVNLGAKVASQQSQKMAVVIIGIEYLLLKKFDLGIFL